ncbi:MAG: hypothetical protein WBC73_18415, partial [Phormidesmis sp.]
SYWLLYTRLYENWGDHFSWIGLVAPVTLTALTLSRRALWPQHLAKFTLVALLLQTPWLTSWPVAIASFAVGTLCMLIQSRQWQHQIAALFTVGSGVACVTCSLWYGLVELPAAEPGRLMIFWAVEIGALWLLAGGLARRSGRWMALYQRAANGWAAGLMVGLLTVGTAAAGIAVQENGPMGIGLTSGDDRFIRYILAASVVLMAAQIASIRSRNSGHRPAEWRYWSLAWAAQIAVTIGLALREIGVEGVAIATLILGAISLIIGDLLVNRRQRQNRSPDNQQTNQQSSYRPSWHGIPVAYALLGSLLGHSLFLANSGFYTMAAAAIFLGVGRRQTSQTSLRVLSYAGLVGFSVGAYELLIYRLLQASGGQPGDGLTLLAALALAIALIERCTSTWLTRYLSIPLIGLRWMAHAHWALGSLGVVAAAVVGVFAGMSQPQGIAIWTATSLLLAAYALAAGNRRWTSQLPGLGYAEWTTLGLLEALLCVAYDRFAWFFDRSVLLTWGGLIACAIGFVFYRAPWERWGWPGNPWRRLGLWLPMLTLSITLGYVPTQSLLVIAAFYAWMAKQFGQARISYLSVFLFDWALLRYIEGQGLLNGLWVSLAFGLSVLYVVEIDPYFQEISRRQQRHWLRTLAVGLIGLTSLYQAEVSEPMLAFAGLTVLLSILSIFAGL